MVGNSARIFELQGLVAFHVILSVGYLSFLAAWWLGSRVSALSREPGSVVFYDLASEVILWLSAITTRLKEVKVGRITRTCLFQNFP